MLGHKTEKSEDLIGKKKKKKKKGEMKVGARLAGLGGDELKALLPQASSW